MLKEHPWDSRGWLCPRYKLWCSGLCWQLWLQACPGGQHRACTTLPLPQSMWGGARHDPPPLCTKLLVPLDPNVITGVCTAAKSLKNISVAVPLTKALWYHSLGARGLVALPPGLPGLLHHRAPTCIGEGLGPSQHGSQAVQESIENCLLALGSETFKNWT